MLTVLQYDLMCNNVCMCWALFGCFQSGHLGRWTMFGHFRICTLFVLVLCIIQVLVLVLCTMLIPCIVSVLAYVILPVVGLALCHTTGGRFGLLCFGYYTMYRVRGFILDEPVTVFRVVYVFLGLLCMLFALSGLVVLIIHHIVWVCLFGRWKLCLVVCATVAIGRYCLYVWVWHWGLGILCVMGHSRWVEVA